MIISTIPVSNCTPQTIVIGRRGTYDTMQIAFDLSYLIENYGSGTAVLAVKRSQDSSAYPAVVTQADNTLTWTVSETDTYYVGSGECQLMWYVEGGLAKTIIYPMVVMRDILSTAEEPPDGYENWVEHLAELGAETQQNAQEAAQSATEAKESEDSAAESAHRAEEAATMLTNVSATATTLAPGEPATAEYNDGVFEFGIPKGDKLTYADLTEADKENLVQGPIKEAQDDAVEAVGTAKTTAVDAVNQAGANQVNAVNGAGTTQVSNVNQAGETQLGNVNTAGTTQVGNVQTEGATQVQAVEDKGNEVLNSIPQDYSDLVDEVTDLSRQISDVDSEFTKLAKFDYLSATDGRIPILYLSGDISEMTKENAVPLDYLFTENGQTGTCTLKWQGASSITNPKKNYTIKFDTAFQTHQWGVQKKYVLKGYYTDFSHARDVCGAKLWGKITKDRYLTVPTADLAPFDRRIEYLYDGENQLENGGEALTVGYFEVWQPNGGAVDGFPIVVVLNDEYIGLYTFNIPKDAWMMGMDNGYSNTECILTAEAVTPATRLMSTALLDGTDWEIEYVSDDDDSWVSASINGAIQDAIDCHSSEAYEALKAKFDMYSAIDYYIFSLLTTNWDGIGHNYFLYTFDGTKWYHGAYDMDNIFGYQWHGYGTNSFTPVVFSPTVTSLNALTTGCRLFQLILAYDKATLKSRYTALRGGILSDANIYDTVYNFVSPVNKSVYDEEVLIWPGIPASETNNSAQIAEYYRMRAGYMDSVINAL